MSDFSKLNQRLLPTVEGFSLLKMDKQNRLFWHFRPQIHEGPISTSSHFGFNCIQIHRESGAAPPNGQNPYVGHDPAHTTILLMASYYCFLHSSSPAPVVASDHCKTFNALKNAWLAAWLMHSFFWKADWMHCMTNAWMMLHVVCEFIHVCYFLLL